MSRKYLLDCSASGAKWADDVHPAMDGFAKSLKRWWARKDSNLRPMDYESTALTN